MTKKICAITMARNDEFFLTKWISYYGNQLGEENLFVFLDGKDQPVPKNAGKANIIHRERVSEGIAKADKSRINYLSEVAADLLKRYDLVIGTDADEFLVVDPQINKTLVEYLSEIHINSSVSALGLDVGQNTCKEGAINPNLPFLSQREYAYVSTRYTKASVIAKPVQWGSGFHRVRGRNFRIDKNLYLFHFGCIDLKMIQDRFLDKDRMNSGWERHLKKRTRTISLISQKKARNGNKWLPIARALQTWLRPVYAWNKPAMLNLKIIIKIPNKFKNTL